jgi:putative ABC transport system ATP-binding protein
MSDSVVVVFTDVVKTFGTGDAAVDAVRGVTLTLQAGELVALSGPSGSGKSTLLHLCGGLVRPTSGAVTVCGQEVGRLGPAALARLRRRQVGYVFQRYNLVPGLTAVENVMLPLEFEGMRPRAARRAAANALERVGLDLPDDRFPDDLSGGEQQRVAIARAIATRREVILADEPTGALDTLTADRTMDLIADLAEAGTAVLLVTHEPRFAALADRVVFLRDGLVVDEALPAPPGTGRADADARPAPTR